MTTFWALTAALPWASLFVLYQLGQVLVSQVGPLRTLGTFLVFALAGLVAAAGMAGLALALRLDRPGWQRFWRSALFTLALVNIAAVGLAIFYQAPAFAPMHARAIAGVAILAMIIAHARYPEAHQQVVGRLLRWVGLGLVAVPLLAAPAVLAAAAKDQARLPGAPQPLAADRIRPDAPRRIVLVTFDGLRARSTAPIAPQARTPRLAALSGRSTWYSQARAASDATLSSVTTILTGLPPQAIFPHVGNKTGFPRQGMTTGLASHLAPAGYHAYYATMLVRPLHFGLAGEFERGQQAANIFPLTNEFNTEAYIPWERSLTWLKQKTFARREADRQLPGGPNAAARTVDAGLDFLKRAPDRSFLWMHLAVPHAPLYPIDFSGKTPRALPSPKVDFNQVGKATLEESRRYEAMYEDYVRYADYEFGRFLDGLAAAGLDRDTLLVVTADHGEEFMPNRISHGSGNLSEDITRVPLIVHRPDQTAGRRVDRLVSHLDVAPTILREVYREVPAGLPGLVLGAEGEPPADRAVLSWGLSRRYFTSVATAEMAALYRWPYKCLLDFQNGRRTLYDLTIDPQALHDIAPAHPETAAGLATEAERALD